MNNLYNNKQRFARISPLRGPCKPRVAARETTMNNASPWTHFLLVVLAKLFHFVAPFLAMAKLERARFCSWLTESVVTCCKGCICCFPLLSRNYVPTKVPSHGTLSRHGITRASSVLLMAYRKSCILLFTLQQDCKHAKRRLLLVVKVVFVVFPNSAGFFVPAKRCYLLQM